MTDWNKQLFSYCERALNGAFWAEPFNALSNIAFILAAIAALTLWLNQKPRQRSLVDGILVGLLFVIGIGSFLFHTFATRWAVLTDVFPITAFMLVYLGCALKRFLGWNWLATGLGLVVFFAALQQAETLRCDGGPCLNGSLGYMPALAALLIIGGLLLAIKHPAWRSILAATLLFAVSLVFRTVDQIYCDLTNFGIAAGPIGTHFIWHVLNAVLLLILVRASIRHGRFTAAVQHGTSILSK